MQHAIVVILGAGQGKRMGATVPKVLVPVCGRPMVEYLLDAVKNSQVAKETILVVSPDNKDVISQTIAGHSPQYAIQYEQLGTAHAVKSAVDYFKDHEGSVVVLYGDCPTVTSDTIKGLVELRENSSAVIAMATTTVPDFEHWRSNFMAFGRIIRNADGTLQKNVEFKDATEEQKAIHEVNPCYFCFDAKWLANIFDEIKNQNAQGEYYLTDALQLAVSRGLKVESLAIDPKEAVGINTQEQRELIEQLLCGK